MSKPKGMTIQQEMQWNREQAEQRQPAVQAQIQRRKEYGATLPAEDELYPVRPR